MIDFWVADDVDYEPEWIDQGSSYELSDEPCQPIITHPIGFQITPPKPRIRIKAWTRPIIEMTDLMTSQEIPPRRGTR